MTCHDLAVLAKKIVGELNDNEMHNEVVLVK